jgi:hypothetical protein
MDTVLNVRGETSGMMNGRTWKTGNKRGAAVVETSRELEGRGIKG